MLFDMAFNLIKLIWAMICLNDVTRESVATLTNHFANAYVRKNIVHLLATL